LLFYCLVLFFVVELLTSLLQKHTFISLWRAVWGVAKNDSLRRENPPINLQNLPLRGFHFSANGIIIKLSEKSDRPGKTGDALKI